MINKDSGVPASPSGSRADASSPQAVSTKGFDPARWAGKIVLRCMGNCNHAPGTCTADADYQRYAAWKRGEDEAVKERILQWPVTRGYVRLTFPASMTPEEVADVEAVVGITLKTMRERAASAGEAGTATTVEQGVVHEHAIGAAKTPDTPNTVGQGEEI